ncbi:GDP-mannose 4,6-dehydratase [Clostridium sp. 19966]|uniref:GDP-mannose 4,6-dehydratase n=1 Tax=Clostridium sp. 19966 TaxID=2768166 RepID=UPI0028E07BCD|nr:GDP-mannose 4,6-dehydratase [Clostridium sp. 19966]MDT8716155.1 GDP-mannose 4,6-dehydratase [Clostridium sp. 19966]
MNILITGVGGFVSKYLVKLLEKEFGNQNIYGTYFGADDASEYISEKNLFPLNINDEGEVKAVLQKVKPDLIFHLAAQSSAAVSWKKPKLTLDTNVYGTLNILNWMKEENKECRLLLIGTGEEYGKIQTVPISEEHEVEPQNPYSISKLTQEMFAKLYAKAFKLNVVMTRSFNHIGPLQLPQFVVADWAKQIVEIERGIHEPIIKVGDINLKRDFTDVRDVVRAYVSLAQKGASGEIYNVGSGNAYLLSDILDMLLSLTNVKIEIQVDQNKLRPAENQIIQCDYSKLNKLCGWEPEYDIKDTLADTLEYWRKTV